MTPQTITRHGWTVTLAGDDTEGYTCTITPPHGPTVAADGPTPVEAMHHALAGVLGSLAEARAVVAACVELLEGLP